LTFAITCGAWIGLVMYAFACWSYWRAGIEHGLVCMDAEAGRKLRRRARSNSRPGRATGARSPVEVERLEAAWCGVRQVQPWVKDGEEVRFLDTPGAD
jgi:hypothetical protein